MDEACCLKAAIAAMGGALLLISVGTGLFKGNLQVMVGNLYDEAQYAAKRDSGFSVFYIWHTRLQPPQAPTYALRETY